MWSLRDCAVAGDSEGAQVLLDMGGYDVNEVDAKGMSPLHIAALQGHSAVAKILIDGGADKDKLDARNGLSPISCAARNGHEPTINLLVRMGCNTNAVTYDGAHMGVMIPMDTLGHYKHSLRFTGRDRKKTLAVVATLKILEAKLAQDKMKHPNGVTIFK
jgi:ankyrin repeat protein